MFFNDCSCVFTLSLICIFLVFLLDLQYPSVSLPSLKYSLHSSLNSFVANITLGLLSICRPLGIRLFCAQDDRELR